MPSILLAVATCIFIISPDSKTKGATTPLSVVSAAKSLWYILYVLLADESVTDISVCIADASSLLICILFTIAVLFDGTVYIVVKFVVLKANPAFL